MNFGHATLLTDDIKLKLVEQEIQLLGLGQVS